jgi:hypothetical protein
MRAVKYRVGSWVFTVVIGVTSALGVGQAQTVPGDGSTLSGKWALDVYLSDSPKHVADGLAATFAPTGSGETERARGRAETIQAVQKDDPRRKELIDAVRFPPLALTISETDTAIRFTDSLGRTRTFEANGKKAPHQFDAGAIDTRTTWVGPQLVIEYDLGQDLWLQYTYSLLPTTKQLLTRVTVAGKSERAPPFEITQVYNRVP